MILIEGVPGSGKSTTALNLHENLNEKGVKTTLYLEAAEQNPFRYHLGTTAETLFEDFTATVSKKWESFFKSYRPRDPAIILEGMTLQQQINFAVWTNKFEEVLPLIEEIARGLKSVQPTLFYLQHKDPAKRFKEVMLERGEEWVDSAVKPISQSPFALYQKLQGISALEGFLEEISIKNIECLDLFDFSVNRINVDSNNWNSTLAEIQASLKL